jgi:hypothetical protein
MNRLGLSVVAAALGAVMTFGCGGGGSVAVDNLADAVANSACDRLVRCGAVADHATCVALYRTLVNEDNLIAGVKAGMIKYDGGKAQECLDALAGASCDPSAQDERVEPPACKDAIKGTVADGGACKNSAECVSNSCNIPSCSMACCAGTCNPTAPAAVAIGQSCAAAPCVDGAYCDATQKCVALLSANASCTSDDQCGYGLLCIGATGSATCAAAPKAGDACVTHNGSKTCIVDGLLCDSTSHCATQLASGTTCDPQAPLCKFDLSCDATAKTCGALPTTGKACAGECAPGSYCKLDQTTGTGTCTAPNPDGTACQNDVECTSNHCDGTTNKCAPRMGCG